MMLQLPKTNTITLRIKGSDIRDADAMSNDDCPVARALKRACGSAHPDIFVGGSFYVVAGTVWQAQGGYLSRIRRAKWDALEAQREPKDMSITFTLKALTHPRRPSGAWPVEAGVIRE